MTIDCIEERDMFLEGFRICVEDNIDFEKNAYGQMIKIEQMFGNFACSLYIIFFLCYNSE